MIRTILIDDEPHNIINLQRLLEEHCSEVTVVATANNAEEGIAVIRKHKPDLVLLDIQMPGKTGFELLMELPEPSFEVIFITAYGQYGIQAIRFSALDYLMKPVDIDELKNAVQKAVVKNVQKHRNEKLQNLVSMLQEGSLRQEHRIALPSAKETRFVAVKDIIRCESSNSYTTFFMQDGEKIVVSVPIHEYEELLQDYGFIRCHQSHIVQKQFVKSMVKENGPYLVMINGEKIPVSRQKKDFVKDELMRNSVS